MKNLSFISLVTILAIWPAVAVAQTDVTFLQEDFDGIVAPALPDGWSADGGTWETDDGSTSDGSGGNNLYLRGTSPANITTPTLDLSTASTATLTYLGRRTSTYDIGQMRVTASVDGGVTFTDTLLAAGSALPAAPSDYASITAELPPDLLVGDLAFRFEALGGGSSGANLRIDDVVVSGQAAVLAVDPKELAFFAAVGEDDQQSFAATNHTGAPVVVDPPQFNSTAFSVDPAGSVPLGDGASQSYTVTFAPTADGEYADVLTLPYGDEAVIIDLAGTTTRDELGFSAASSMTLEESQGVEIPILLQHSAADGLQGLQFRTTWSDPLIEAVAVERGADVADTDAWTLDAKAAPGAIDVVLVNTTNGTLPAGQYDGLLTLVLDLGDTGGADVDAVLEMEGIVGAWGVPGGSDAGLQPGLATHTLTIEERLGQFTLSADLLDLGTVAVGDEGEAEVTVSNPGGTQALTVSDVSSSNPLFTVTPGDASIAPGADQVFTITFAPTMAAFGPQETDITFVHDGGASGSDVLAATATGISGRGDTDSDGRVDVVDLVQVIDIVLGREEPAGPQAASADLYPFPDGDGAFDVRDLVVLVQAIVRGTWPDEATVPAERVAPAPTPRALAKVASDADTSVVAFLHQGADGVHIEVDHTRPFRALQLTLSGLAASADPEVMLPPEGYEGVSVAAHADEAADIVRVVAYRADGGSISPGRLPLVMIPARTNGAHVGPAYATAVDDTNARLPVAVQIVEGTDASGPRPLPEHLRLGAPFPQPLSSTNGVLNVPVAVPEPMTLRAELFDLLGRRVAVLPPERHAAGYGQLTWNGRDSNGQHAASGVYVLRIRGGTHADTRSIVVAR